MKFNFDGEILWAVKKFREEDPAELNAKYTTEHLEEYGLDVLLARDILNARFKHAAFSGKEVYRPIIDLMFSGNVDKAFQKALANVIIELVEEYAAILDKYQATGSAGNTIEQWLITQGYPIWHLVVEYSKTPNTAEETDAHETAIQSIYSENGIYNVFRVFEAKTQDRKTIIVNLPPPAHLAKLERLFNERQREARDTSEPLGNDAIRLPFLTALAGYIGTIDTEISDLRTKCWLCRAVLNFGDIKQDKARLAKLLQKSISGKHRDETFTTYDIVIMNECGFWHDPRLTKLYNSMDSSLKSNDLRAAEKAYDALFDDSCDIYDDMFSRPI